VPSSSFRLARKTGKFTITESVSYGFKRSSAADSNKAYPKPLALVVPVLKLAYELEIVVPELRIQLDDKFSFIETPNQIAPPNLGPNPLRIANLVELPFACDVTGIFIYNGEPTLDNCSASGIVACISIPTGRHRPHSSSVPIIFATGKKREDCDRGNDKYDCLHHSILN
jgi:hypothetical protein